ncbi:MAG: NAD(P)/FAD-dependent oxidoreductase [Clostridiaceae bacterium]|nr:NAD(P)/FAD-dependent oxidoreductase [Clostridiaceae bacterium]
MNHVVVIGAGAAGLLAAWQAARTGAQVTLLEKNGQCGRKIRVSGSGRCNLTNAAPLDGFIGAYFGQGRFLFPAFRHFFRPELIALLAQQGVTVKTEPNGKVFPVSDRAADIAEALEAACRAAGVQIRLGETVNKLTVGSAGLEEVISSRAPYPAQAALITCGGSSWPGTGSTGDGYRLAAKAGHPLTELRPALVPLTCAESWPQRLSGISCPSADVRLVAANKPVARTRGDLLFTHTGLSGPAVLRLSRDYLPQAETEVWQLLINLLPDLAQADVLAALREACREQPRQLLYNAVSGAFPGLPRALLASVAGIARIPDNLTAGHVSNRLLTELTTCLQQLTLTVSGTHGYREAMVTAGGVRLDTVDPRTLMSRLVPGLFLAGEVLDIDGDTGGYNLQAAFSTGSLAGFSAARYVQAQP